MNTPDPTRAHAEKMASLLDRRIRAGESMLCFGGVSFFEDIAPLVEKACAARNEENAQ